MLTPNTFHAAPMMGGWVIDMADLHAAQAAIASCRAALPDVLEVRHTLWGVQVKTESRAAADLLAASYAPMREPAALAA